VRKVLLGKEPQNTKDKLGQVFKVCMEAWKMLGECLARSHLEK